MGGKKKQQILGKWVKEIATANNTGLFPKKIDFLYQ